YGRLLKELDQQIAAFRAAVERDPGLTRAQIALGTALLGKESYAEAFEALGHALELPDRPDHHPDDLYLTYAQAAVGAGTLGPADQELKKRSGGKTEGVEAIAEARWLLALAGGRFDDALSLLNAHEDAAPHDSTVW